MAWHIYMHSHDDVIKWKHFPRYWPFVRGIHRSLVNSPHKGQWCGALIFFFDLRLNERLSKQSWGWWFETLSRPLWRHCNGTWCPRSSPVRKRLVTNPTNLHVWYRDWTDNTCLWDDSGDFVAGLTYFQGSTGRGLNKMAVISQTTCSNAFHSKNILVFDSNLAEFCSLESNWQQVNICSCKGLSPNRWQAITRTNVHPGQIPETIWYVMYVASLGKNGFIPEGSVQGQYFKDSGLCTQLIIMQYIYRIITVTHIGA